MASPPSPTQSGDDHARKTFKRDRESDTSAQQPTTPSEAIPTKKNRLELGSAAAEGDGSPSLPQSSAAGAEKSSTTSASTVAAPPRKQAFGFSSFAKVSPFAKAAPGSPALAGAQGPAGTKSIFDSPTESSKAASASAEPSSAAAATTDSSDKDSKENVSADTKESRPDDDDTPASAAAAETSDTVAAERPGAPPSAQGSPLIDSQGSSSSAAEPSSRKQPFGFGSFAKVSPFAKATGSASPLAGASTSAGTKSVFEAKSSEKSAASAEAASESKASEESTPSENAAEARSNVDNVQAFQRRADEDSTVAAATDRTTGEEAERTVFSARGRLFEMDTATQNWKERGAGTIKCNVPNESSGGLFGAGRGASQPGSGKRRSPARLVMRTDGVLRLILNVVLFPGMSVELAQEKFVRFAAIEDGKPVHLAVRIPQPKTAEELFNTIKARIPASASTAEGQAKAAGTNEESS